MAGIGSTVTIRQDRWGIPHIEAESGVDGWFGLGFCHAQDRGFQLETLLRAGRGTLAELAGPSTLPIDRLSRRLGFARVARDQLPMLAPNARQTLEAYVAGVNAALERGGRRPHELVLARARPTRWEARDVLAFLGLQSFALAGNWDVELARLKVLAEDGPEALAAIDPAYAEWHPVTSPVGAAAGETAGVAAALAADMEALRGVVGGGGASNHWAIAGSRARNRRPILACDPHLAPQLPAPWYLAHVVTPEWEVAGASFVGGPVFPIGQNGHVAWGVTAALTDSTDLFVEQVGADGASVREGDDLVPCEVMREEIRVRGRRVPHVEEVLLTPRGPVISPLLTGISHVLSLRAPWQRPQPIRGMLELPEARSFEEFRRPFAEWPGPALNVAYADADGHVGWQLVGQLPRRRHGHGLLPAPGWLPDRGWEDEPLPFDELPCELDPPAGFVATANNQPTPTGDAPFLGSDWIDGYRLARIVEELEVRDDWDVEASLRLQTDLASLPWRELREFILALPTRDHRAARGVELLRVWSGQMAPDSSAATVFALFVAELSSRVAEARAPRSWRWSLGDGFGPILPRTLFVARSVGHLVRLLRDRPSGWFGGPRSWTGVAADALASVVGRLEAEHGTDPDGWRWGSLRPLTLRHPLGGGPPLGRLFDLGPVSVGGDTNTVAQASVNPLRPLGNVGAIANVRAVMDLGDPEASRFVLAGGQSGNPYSPHYGDQFELWRRGDALSIAWSPAAVEAATVATLRLEPR